MKLLLVGCEYAGTTTLAYAIRRWVADNMGTRIRIVHDHFKIPHTVGHPSELTEAEQEQYLALSPRIKETAQRHNIYYHTPSEAFFDRDPDRLVIGLHIEDAIYGPLYFGYGGEGQEGDRRVISRHIEQRIMRFAPDTVLVLVKAAANVIARRMSESPHPRGVLRKEDVDYVLARFEGAYDGSMIRRKVTLDTSTATVEGTVAEFVRQVEPHLTEEDRLRLLLHGGWPRPAEGKRPRPQAGMSMAQEE